MDKNIIIILILIIFLVATDKIITFINIQSVEKNFPEIDKFSIEKNPLAKFFFNKLGLVWGTIIYFILSVITIVIALILLDLSLKLLHVQNHMSISLYIMIILYCLVIGNNLFFLLKFNKIVP